MLFPLTLILQIANSESKFSQLLIHSKSRFECLLCARHQGYSSKGNRQNPCPLRVYILLRERQTVNQCVWPEYVSLGASARMCVVAVVVGRKQSKVRKTWLPQAAVGHRFTLHVLGGLL